ncbi:hypothetical protein MP638_001107 [Amoeboaphelidium occidentale]|nr:hypothetical protein MP638_001107 [Amoeboaphelidium occidentale]
MRTNISQHYNKNYISNIEKPLSYFFPLILPTLEEVESKAEIKMASEDVLLKALVFKEDIIVPGYEALFPAQETLPVVAEPEEQRPLKKIKLSLNHPGSSRYAK